MEIIRPFIYLSEYFLNKGKFRTWIQSRCLRNFVSTTSLTPVSYGPTVDHPGVVSHFVGLSLRPPFVSLPVSTTYDLLTLLVGVLIETVVTPKSCTVTRVTIVGFSFFYLFVIIICLQYPCLNISLWPFRNLSKNFYLKDKSLFEFLFNNYLPLLFHTYR